MRTPPAPKASGCTPLLRLNNTERCRDQRAERRWVSYTAHKTLFHPPPSSLFQNPYSLSLRRQAAGCHRGPESSRESRHVRTVDYATKRTQNIPCRVKKKKHHRLWYFAGGGVILRSPCYLIVDLYLLRRLVSEHPKTSPGCCSLRGVLSYVGVFSNVGDDTTVLSPRAPMDAALTREQARETT